MKSRALRVLLVTLCVGSMAAAAYVGWTEGRRARTEGAAATRYEGHVRRVSRALLDVKGAQAGYVAAGQGEEFWFGRVEALLAAAREALDAAAAEARTPDAQADVAAADTALGDFSQMDRRAREYVRNGQRLLASDLIFSDGLERLDAAIAAIERAGAREIALHEGAAAQGRRLQLLTAAGAGLATLLVAFLLLPLPPLSSARETAGADADAIDTAAAAPGTAVAPAPAPTPDIAPLPSREAAPDRRHPELRAGEDDPGPDVTAIASVCAEISRISDTQALPSALERAAALLDAAGIVVWIADPDGRELAPIVAFGYPQTLIIRMGTIPREAENVTAAAFRTGVLQTVRSEDGSAGAIAAPLLTPVGPIGVMAAEVRHQAEGREATRAAAAIVAAQLAALFGPPSVRSAARTEAAGA